MHTVHANLLRLFHSLQEVLPALLHGEAVNIDMAFMVYVAHERGLVTEDEKLRIVDCMLGLELPVWHRGFTLALVQRALRERLRHSGGLVRMPLPTGLGCAGTEAFTSQNTVVFTCAFEI